MGQVHENSILKIAFDQITDGQLRFAELDPHVDTVVIGPPMWRIVAGGNLTP